MRALPDRLNQPRMIGPGHGAQGGAGPDQHAISRKKAGKTARQNGLAHAISGENRQLRAGLPA